MMHSYDNDRPCSAVYLVTVDHQILVRSFYKPWQLLLIHACTLAAMAPQSRQRSWLFCYFQANKRSWRRRLGLQSMSMNEFLLLHPPPSRHCENHTQKIILIINYAKHTVGWLFDFVNKLPVLGIGGGKSESKNQQFWLFATPLKNIWVYERTTNGSFGGYLTDFRKLRTTAIYIWIQNWIFDFENCVYEP